MMIDLTCADARDLAAEFALDILEPEERSAVAAHLLRCPSCRAEVANMEVVSERLLDLVPGTEPPLGFDRRVLARVQGGAVESGDAPVGSGSPPGRVVGWRGVVRRRPRIAVAIAALSAAAAVGVGSIGWMAGHNDHATQPRVMLSAAFRQGGHDVGEVYAYAGHPEWLEMTIDAGGGAGHLICEVMQRDGSVQVLGAFDLVGGRATWGAPDPAGVKGMTGVRLVDSQGHVVATATLPS